MLEEQIFLGVPEESKGDLKVQRKALRKMVENLYDNCEEISKFKHHSKSRPISHFFQEFQNRFSVKSNKNTDIKRIFCDFYNMDLEGVVAQIKLIHKDESLLREYLGFRKFPLDLQDLEIFRMMARNNLGIENPPLYLKELVEDYIWSVYKSEYQTPITCCWISDEKFSKRVDLISIRMENKFSPLTLPNRIEIYTKFQRIFQKQNSTQEFQELLKAVRVKCGELHLTEEDAFEVEKIKNFNNNQNSETFFQILANSPESLPIPAQNWILYHLQFMEFEPDQFTSILNQIKEKNISKNDLNWVLHQLLNKWLKKFETIENTQILSQISRLFNENLPLCMDIPQPEYLSKYFKWRLRKKELMLVLNGKMNMISSTHEEILNFDDPENILNRIAKFAFGDFEESDCFENLLNEYRFEFGDENISENIRDINPYHERPKFYTKLFKLIQTSVEGYEEMDPDKKKREQKLYSIGTLALTHFFENNQLRNQFIQNSKDSTCSLGEIGDYLETILSKMEDIDGLNISPFFRIGKELLAPDEIKNNPILKLNLEKYFEGECHTIFKSIQQKFPLFRANIEGCLKNIIQYGDYKCLGDFFNKLEEFANEHGYVLEKISTLIESWQILQIFSNDDLKHIKSDALRIYEACSTIFQDPSLFFKLIQMHPSDNQSSSKKEFENLMEILNMVLEEKLGISGNFEAKEFFEGIKFILIHGNFYTAVFPYSFDIYKYYIEKYSIESPGNDEKNPVLNKKWDFIRKLAVAIKDIPERRNFYIRVFQNWIKELKSPFEKLDIFNAKFAFTDNSFEYRYFIALLTKDEKDIWEIYLKFHQLIHAMNEKKFRVHFKDILCGEMSSIHQYLLGEISQCINQKLVSILGSGDQLCDLKKSVRKIMFFARLDNSLIQILEFLKIFTNQLSFIPILSIREVCEFLNELTYLRRKDEYTDWIGIAIKVVSNYLPFNWLKQIYISRIKGDLKDLFRGDSSLLHIMVVFKQIRNFIGISCKSFPLYEREFFKILANKLSSEIRIQSKLKSESILEIFQCIERYFTSQDEKFLENIRNYDLLSWASFLPNFGLLNKGIPTGTLNKLLSMDKIPKESIYTLIEIIETKFPLKVKLNMEEFCKIIDRIYSLDLSIDIQLLERFRDGVLRMKNAKFMGILLEEYISDLKKIQEYKYDDLLSQMLSDNINRNFKVEREILNDLIYKWEQALNGTSIIMESCKKPIKAWDTNIVKEWSKARGNVNCLDIGQFLKGFLITGINMYSGVDISKGQPSDEDVKMKQEGIMIESLAVISRGVKLISGKEEYKKKSKKLQKELFENPEKGKEIEKKISNLNIENLGYYPRHTQILAVLLFLRSQNGRLGEIATGEGKTVICAMLAISWALDRKNVNIISSSSVLALANQNDWKALFELFEIPMGNNCDPTSLKCSETQLQERYRKLVIYGDLGSFETHILKTLYFDKGITAGREPDYVIVDEVDSMLLDKAAHMLYISHAIPEFKYLRQIFLRIWQLIQNDGQGIQTNAYAILEQIQKEIGDKLKFPQSIRDFVETRLLIWIKNAYEALKMDEGVNYISKDNKKEEGKECVVDNLTGVEEPNMQYSYGLQQAIQMKHFNRMSQETLKAYFISNFKYFKDLEGKIFGFTGTLGTEKDRDLIRNNYGVDFFRMPRHKFRDCVQLDPKIGSKREDWMMLLKEVVIQQTTGEKPRSVLIVTENISQANNIEEYLMENGIQDVKNYKSSFDEDFKKNVLEKDLEVGKVIVATNIGGRGTDIKLSGALEENGGIHVVLAYLPDNLRVELQAFGRAARAGNSGSCQFVIQNLDTYFEAKDIFDMKKIRDWRDSERLSDIEKKELPKIQIQENLLEKFWEFYKEIKKNIFNLPKDPEHKLQLTFLNNRWALWLDGIQKDIDRVDIFGSAFIEAKYEKFQNDMQILADSRSFEKMLFEKIKLAKIIEAAGGRNDKSVELLKDVISEEEEFIEMAHLYRAGLAINIKEISTTARKNAKTHLKSSKLAIYQRQEQLYCSLLMTEVKNSEGQKANNPKEKEDTKFMKQVKNELAILDKFDSAIVEMIGFDLTPDILQKIPGISNEKEAESILEELLTLGLVRSTKLRQNLEFTFEKPNEYSGYPKYKIKINENNTIKIPGKFLHIAERLVKYLEEITNSSNRFLEVKNMEEIVQTRDEVWNILKERLMEIPNGKYKVEKCESIEFDEGKFNKILPEKYEKLKIPLALFLNEFSKDTSDPKLMYDSRKLKHFLMHEYDLPMKDLKNKFEEIERILKDGEIIIQSEMIFNAGELPIFNLKTPELEKHQVLEEFLKDNSPKGSEETRLETALKALANLYGNQFNYEDISQYFKDENQYHDSFETQLTKMGLLLNEYQFILQDNLELGQILYPVFHQRPDTLEGILQKKRIPLEGTKSECARDLFDYLLSEGILKKWRVKFPYFGSANEVDEKIANIGKKIKDSGRIKAIFDEAHSFAKEKEKELEEIAREFSKKESNNIFSHMYNIWTSSSDVDKVKEKYDKALKKYQEGISKFVVSSAGTIKIIAKPDLKYRNLAEEFSQGEALLQELIEYAEEGSDMIPYLIIKKERFPIGACIAIGIGFGQIALGGLMIFFSGGLASPVALILLSEGVSDVLYGLHHGYTGNFSWGGYAANKAMSLTINACTLGTGGSINFAAKAGSLATRTILYESAKECGKFIAKKAAYGAFAAISDEAITYALDVVREWGFTNFKTLFLQYLEKEGSKEESTIGKRLRELDSNLLALYEISYNNEHFRSRMAEFSEGFCQDDRTSWQMGVLHLAASISSYLQKTFLEGFEKSLSSSNIELKCAMTLINFAKTLYSNNFGNFDMSFYLEKGGEFICASLDHANSFFSEETANLSKDREGKDVVVDKMSEEKFRELTTAYQKELNVKLFENTLLYIQKELLEPGLKRSSQVMIREIVSRKCQRNYNGFRKSVSESTDKIKRNLKGGEQSVGGEVKSSGNANFIDMADVIDGREIGEQNPPNAMPVENLDGKDVGDLRQEFGPNVDFYEDKYGKIYADIQVMA